MNRSALTLGVALVAFLVGAGFVLRQRHGPLPPEARPLDSLRVRADGPQARVPRPSQAIPPTSPADELAKLPPIPEDHPRGENYVIISREWNRLWLMRDEQVLRAALCATGKGDTLTWEEGEKTWVFETPAGEFTVQHKTSNPRWVPPEWEYVERGEEPPDWLGRNRAASYDMLGDYAINFGGDYNIHGTIYEGLLGQSITHGCVRVGARDLACIYPRVQKGTRVFVY